MIRTKHAYLFLVALFIFSGVLIYTHLSQSFTRTTALIPKDDLFEHEERTFMLAPHVEEDREAKRAALLAKLDRTKHVATAIEFASENGGEERGDETSDNAPETELPREGEFDWSEWNEKLPELSLKKTAYEANIATLTTELQAAREARTALLARFIEAQGTTSPEVTTLESALACLTEQIDRGEHTLMMLEESERVPLGLLYGVLIEEIEMEINSADVLELYEQSVRIAAENETLIASYKAGQITCDVAENSPPAEVNNQF